MYTVYKHTLNNKIYIGITCQKPHDRWVHGWGYKECPRFWNAIKKYGWKNVQHEILFTGLTKEEAEAKEIELIALYHSADRRFGYNIDNGGSCVGKCSDEHKRKLSEKLSGKNNPFYGRKHSEETKKLISLNHADVSGANHPKAKAVVCIETGAIYASVHDAEKVTGIIQPSISKCCLGYRKTAGGFHWSFAESVVAV